MKINLVAPFRCRFVLDSHLCTKNPEFFLRLLGQYWTEHWSEKEPPFEVPEVRRALNPEVAGPRYKTMDEDSTFSSNPWAFSLVYGKDYLSELNAEGATRFPGLMGGAAGAGYEVRSFSCYVFNYSIGVASMCLESPRDLSGEDCLKVLKQLEPFSFDLMSHAMERGYKECLGPFLTGMLKHDKTMPHTALKQPPEYVVMRDVWEGDGANLGTPLWVNRTVITAPPQGEKAAVWKEWLGSPCFANVPGKNLEGVQNHTFLGWGSNLVISRDDVYARSIHAVVVQLQYFYAGFEALNINLSAHTVMTISPEQARRLREVNKELEEMNSVIDMLRIDYRDIWHGMQGYRRTAWEDIEKSWSLKGLIELVEWKLSLYVARVERLNEMSSLHYQKMSELLLASISGIAVGEFTIHFLHFYHLNEHLEDSKVKKVLSVWNADGWMLFALIVVVVGFGTWAALHFRSGHSKEGGPHLGH